MVTPQIFAQHSTTFVYNIRPALLDMLSASPYTSPTDPRTAIDAIAAIEDVDEDPNEANVFMAGTVCNTAGCAGSMR